MEKILVILGAGVLVFLLCFSVSFPFLLPVGFDESHPDPMPRPVEWCNVEAGDSSTPILIQPASCSTWMLVCPDGLQKNCVWDPIEMRD